MASRFALIADIIPDVSKVGISLPSIAPNLVSIPDKSTVGISMLPLTRLAISS